VTNQQLPPQADPQHEETGGLARDLADYNLSTPKQLLLLLLNSLQMWHAALVLCVLFIPWAPWAVRMASGIAVLYMLPPILARFILIAAPPVEGEIRPDQPGFMRWWALLNLQMLFNRFQAFEEILRLVPALYSAWLRLWGGKVGHHIYWSPGTRILDRSFVRIGNGVVFGAGVRINPHVFHRNKKGAFVLALATVDIGERALIGGYSLLAAGTTIPPGECTRALLLSPPFTHWEEGKRIRQ
jgi:hypothetical protein